MLFREDAYLRDAPARVIAHTAEGGVVLDASIFYPTGGGQPGDSGWLEWDGSACHRHSGQGRGRRIVLVPAEPQPCRPSAPCDPAAGLGPPPQTHARAHGAASAVGGDPVRRDGRANPATHGRLDFDMPDAPEDREDLKRR